MKNRPPRIPLLLLRFYCKKKYVEQIEGDLLEIFEREPIKLKRNIALSWNVLRFMRWRYLKNLDDYEQFTSIAMIRNYLKVAFRSLIRQSTYSGINIMGLAFGLAACLLIMMYVFHERSYDTFFPNAERIYRVANGSSGRFTPTLLARTMKEEYPQVEASTKISGLSSSNIKIGDRIFSQDGIASGDESVFEVFEVKFISGNAEKALIEPNSMVLSQSLANKFFPDQNAQGKIIEVDGEPTKISAIVEDLPSNTHFPFKAIIAELIDPKEKYYWSGNNYWTYIKLTEGVDPYELEEQLIDLYAKYVGPELAHFTGHESFEEFVKENPDRLYGFTLHPLLDIHLKKPHFSMGPRGDLDNVIIFSSIAIFILLIACINYINMTTARSAIRSKEVGLRKALGSYRRSIITQFLVESSIITLISVVIAIGISIVSIPYFNQLAVRSFEVQDLFSTKILLSILVLLTVVGLLAGAYPAFAISGFSPIKAIKGDLQQVSKTKLRNGLVVFQFAISIFLVTVTAVIFRQVTFMQSQDLGIEIEKVLVINNGIELEKNYDFFKSELENLNEVEAVAKSSGVPFHFIGSWNYYDIQNNNLVTSPYNIFAEPGFEQVLGLELVTGRYFDETRVTDTSSVIINQEYARQLGWKEPIGMKISRGLDSEFDVIGVVEDFNFATLKRRIGPLLFRYGHPSFEIGINHQQHVIVKLRSNDFIRSVKRIEEKWTQVVPDIPFDAVFMDESFQSQYESEIKFGQIFTTFSSFAIFIAFLGLFALATFILQKRIKEIALRKVLGASVSDIIRMMLKYFIKLVFIGGFLGLILSFYWLEDWLQDYNERIELSWYLLVMPIILIIFITSLVVSIKSYLSAIANPTYALKEE